MANFYTQATMDPFVKLTEPQRQLLELSGAATEPQRDGTSYVYWEECLIDCLSDELSDDIIKEENLSTETVEFVKREGFVGLLRKILMDNSPAKRLRIDAAYTCDKMRPDSFGGFSLVVTPSHYLWQHTNSIEVDENGDIVNTAEVVAF